MPDFPRVPAAVFSPTACVTCSTTSDPDGFVDSGIELFGYGRLYLCSRCVAQAADRFGMVSAAGHRSLVEDLASANATIDQLEAELGDRAPTVVVTLDHLRDLIVQGLPALDPTKCPTCGGDKAAKSRQCRACYEAEVEAAKA